LLGQKPFCGGCNRKQQQAAAKRNIKKPARAARLKRTVAQLPKRPGLLSAKNELRLNERNGRNQNKVEEQ
jgi:hypothetical protein